MQKNQHSECQNFALEELDAIDSNYGFIVIKPDAVENDLTEFLIWDILTRLKFIDPDVAIDYVFPYEFKSAEEVRDFYRENSQLPEDFVRSIINYMLSGTSVIVVYKSKDSFAQGSFIDVIKNIKGKTMFNWSYEEVKTKKDTNQFVRGLLPLPGSDHLQKRIRERVLERLEQKSDGILTTEELNYYVMNLVHSPDSLDELRFVLDLLPEEYKEQLLSKYY